MPRLIDADALMADINGSLNAMTNIGIAVDGDWLWAKLNDAIEDAPTIEERKKGKWIPHPNKELREWDVCTACGTGCKRREYGTNPDGTEYITEFSYLYCPNCGCEMCQEGEEHGEA